MDNNLSPGGKELMTCLEIGKLLTSTFSREEILENILIKGSELIDANNWSLLLYDELTGELQFEIVVGVDADVVKNIKLKPGEGVASYVAETGESLFLKDVLKSDHFSDRVDSFTGFVTESIICVPLKSHDTVLGVLEIVNVKDHRIFEEKNHPIVSIMADYVAIAINNAKIFDSINRLSITEEYTGLYNSRYLHILLDEYIKDAENDTVFSVVFVDIDNFKEVVDRCGHLLGSKILCEVGSNINECLSTSDTLIKYGGDEYVIIMKGKNKKESLNYIEKIIMNLREAEFLKDEGKNVKITASFGTASFPEDAKTKNDILILADEHMYKIKRANKDGVFSV
ncbi:MAG: sensor domain-containing diguanylate cyclase [Desulfobacterales bacterium]|nr:sensor domain-containing diguanylate cyclase [Desulfobacterales bacterium]MCP4163348.1 sensor domain-containing diguanylate cyclase [Deltaproteobacteria bacterium]